MIWADLRTRVSLMDSLVAGGRVDFTLTKGRIDKHRNRNLASQYGNNWDVSARRKVVDSQTSFPYVRPGVSHRINANYCVSAPLCRQLTQDKQTLKSVNLYQPYRTGLNHRNHQETLNLYQCHQTRPVSGETVEVCQTVTNVVNSVVVNCAHIDQGQPQRKGVSLTIVRQHQSLKYVNNVSCVDQLCSVKLAPNIPNVAQNLPVMAKLNQF